MPVGGGFAGVEATRYWIEAAKRSDVDLTLFGRDVQC
jgi:hypothetical protein